MRIGTGGVLIDVTVLDKDGRPVTDLIAADFDIREDGKPAQIVTATLIRGGVPAPLSGAVAQAPLKSSPSAESGGTRVAVPTRAIPTVTLLGYQPTNTALDGKFRNVTVKVKRGKYTVRARRGYIAAQ